MGDLEQMPKRVAAEETEVMDEGKKAEVEAAQQELEGKAIVFLSHLKEGQEGGMDQLIEEYTELCDEIVQKTQELFGLPEKENRGYADFYCKLYYDSLWKGSEDQGDHEVFREIARESRRRELSKEEH
jgi:hypothetical protein